MEGSRALHRLGSAGVDSLNHPRNANTPGSRPETSLRFDEDGQSESADPQPTPTNLPPSPVWGDHEPAPATRSADQTTGRWALPPPHRLAGSSPAHHPRFAGVWAERPTAPGESAGNTVAFTLASPARKQLGRSRRNRPKDRETCGSGQAATADVSDGSPVPLARFTRLTHRPGARP
jgi:hypothetical protein